jgi:DNA (cytosine-5)-methyltransferase 1
MKARNTSFTFIDLFAGIGGFRIALENLGGKCVFASEWDSFAARTYEANFGDKPAGDITKIAANDIPDHDILTAGFPCQPFSIAGIGAYNALGKAHGFQHATQGTLFFDVARIIRAKRPRAFLLENVKNLLSHDKGRTFYTIIQTLKGKLNYHIYPELIDARWFVPQHRERIYIIGFREDLDFRLPPLDKHRQPKLKDILESRVAPKYTLTDRLWKYLQNRAEKQRAKGNGFGFSVADLNGVSRTLTARYYKDGSEILIPQRHSKNPRRLIPRECARLMGFPEDFKIAVSDSRAYKQFGNSVVIPVVEYVASYMLQSLKKEHSNE